MNRRDNYIRLDHGLMNDPDFQPILRDARLLGSFIQLVRAADVTWPDEATVPGYVDRKVFRYLAATPFLVALPFDAFRVPLIDNDRGPRSAQSSAAANRRWDKARADADAHADASADAHADAYAERMPPQPHPHPHPQKVPTRKTRTGPDGSDDAQGSRTAEPDENGDLSKKKNDEGRRHAVTERVSPDDSHSDSLPESDSDSLSDSRVGGDVSVAVAASVATVTATSDTKLTLTTASRDGWGTWVPQGVIDAWHGGGRLKGAPSAAQQTAMFDAIDARPEHTASVIAHAIGQRKRADQVVAAVLDAWHEVAKGVAPDPPPHAARHESVTVTSGLTRIGSKPPQPDDRPRTPDEVEKARRLVIDFGVLHSTVVAYIPDPAEYQRLLAEHKARYPALPQGAPS